MSYHYSDNEQCDVTSDSQDNGVTFGSTFWGPRASNLTINANSTENIYFTPTQPEGYYGKNACIITFNAYATTNVSSDVQLIYSLNDVQVGGCSLSGVANRGGMQAWEFANAGSMYYDTQENKFSIRNTNTNTAVILEDIKIVRIYQMYGLNASGPSEVIRGTHDTFDATRTDFPCNWKNCGGRGFTTFDGPWTSIEPPIAAGNIIISPNSSHEWTVNWDNANYSTPALNYLEEEICLFNFNQVHVTSPSSLDVKLEAYLNDIKFAEYYISNQGSDSDPHGFFPTYNLAAYRGIILTAIIV